MHRTRSRAFLVAAGFTLTELLVVISLMLILTTAFLLRQQQFNSATIMRSLSYSIALSIRQAQAYGLSSRESVAGAFDTETAAKAYGVYFTPGSSYILFADTNNDGQYDSGTDITVQTFNLSTGYTISSICATDSSGTQTCSPTISDLTLLFRRPNPDACFASSLSPSACAVVPSGTQYSSAYIQISGSSDTRSITVLVTGQISVGAKGS